MDSGNKTKKLIPAGAVLFMEGDPGGSGYYLESGKIEIWISRGNKRVPLAMLSDGEFVGELSAVDLAPRSASAVAVEDCVVVEFDHQQIANRIKAMDPVMRHLTGSLVDRIRSTNSQISDHFGNAERGLAKATIRRPVDLSCLDELTLETDLLKAAKNNEFELHFQPIVDIKRMKLAGFEALIRWQLNGQMLSPDKFIPVAEESRQIQQIGRWVITEAIQQIAQWNNSQDRDLSMSINLSALQLEEADLPVFLRQVLSKYDVEPSLIYLELTETALIDNTQSNINVINQLSQLGCKIALDDFGIGYSSVSHLRDFPIHTVKVDKSLMPVDTDIKTSIQLIRGLVSMIHFLELEIIGEGIETEQHLNLSQEIGIHKVQGYHLSRPLRRDQIEAQYFLNANSELATETV